MIFTAYIQITLHVHVYFAILLQIYRHCADLDTSGLKDPRLHENTKISCLYNLARLYSDHNFLQVREDYLPSCLKNFDLLLYSVLEVF
jgi:hypothetical protein